LKLILYVYLINVNLIKFTYKLPTTQTIMTSNNQIIEDIEDQLLETVKTASGVECIISSWLDIDGVTHVIKVPCLRKSYFEKYIQASPSDLIITCHHQDTRNFKMWHKKFVNELSGITKPTVEAYIHYHVKKCCGENQFDHQLDFQFDFQNVISKNSSVGLLPNPL